MLNKFENHTRNCWCINYCSDWNIESMVLESSVKPSLGSIHCNSGLV